jgi:hypothetical protein
VVAADVGASSGCTAGIAGAAGSVVMRAAPSVEYAVRVVSADVPGNGTDGEVYVTLTGSNGALLRGLTQCHFHHHRFLFVVLYPLMSGLSTRARV